MPIRRVGRVAGLYRYPIKSMGGQALERTHMDRYGLVGDRRFALRRRGDASGFPWLTAGRVPALVRYRIDSDDAILPPLDALQVLTPEGEQLSLHGGEFVQHIADRFGFDTEVLHLNQGMFDWAGISIITKATLSSIGRLVGAEIDARRFRPNILLEADVDSDAHGLSADQYPEDTWIGGELRFGSDATGARVRVTDSDERCGMIGLDPDTGVSSPAILKAVVRHRANQAGIYAVPVRVGAIALGDVVYLHDDA